MPPASARQMAADLALLPVWYASPESAVLAPSAYNLDFLREMQQHLSLPVELMTEPEVALEENLKPMPWGWNPALRKRLQLLGVPESELLSLSQLEKLRVLSHRSRAVELLSHLQLDELFCGEVEDMFVLMWYVIQVNFSGFFKKLAARFGLVGDLFQKAQTTQNTAPLT